MDTKNLVGIKRTKPGSLEEEKDDSPNSSSQPLPEKGAAMTSQGEEDEDGGVLSEENQALIALYGNRIRVVRWCFENDSAVKRKKQNGGGKAKPKVDRRTALARQGSYGDEYDSEYDEEDYASEVEGGEAA